LPDSLLGKNGDADKICKNSFSATLHVILTKINKNDVIFDSGMRYCPQSQIMYDFPGETRQKIKKSDFLNQSQGLIRFINSPENDWADP